MAETAVIQPRRAGNLPMPFGAPALVAQGIEYRPPEPVAQVRILPRAPFKSALTSEYAQVRAYCVFAAIDPF